MKYGFVLPSGDARAAANLARLAEDAGWDGFFVWEPVWGVEAWVQLAAAAMVTERIRLGTMLSPLSRMRPWKLAGEAASVDNLSGGRVILSVGLGAVDTGFAAFGEVTDRRTRAELMDEGLAIVTGLWRGQPFRYQGRHYVVQPTDFAPPPPPVQQPRIPIWIVGVWPRPKSMRRALAYDGILPAVQRPGDDGSLQTEQADIDDVRAIRDHVARERPGGLDSFDIVVEGTTPGEDRPAATAVVAPWAEAGATWWIEAMWGSMSDSAAVERRARQGPPG